LLAAVLPEADGERRRLHR